MTDLHSVKIFVFFMKDNTFVSVALYNYQLIWRSVLPCFFSYVTDPGAVGHSDQTFFDLCNPKVRHDGNNFPGSKSPNKTVLKYK